MRVLLVHPDDGFQRIWKKDRWDCIVDLARAPQSFYSEQADILGCKVSSIYDFALGIEDLRNWRSLLAAGLGKVVDRAGVDWWDVLGLLLQPDLQDVRLALRLADSLTGCRELASTRPSMWRAQYSCGWAYLCAFCSLASCLAQPIVFFAIGARCRI